MAIEKQLVINTNADEVTKDIDKLNSSLDETNEQLEDVNDKGGKGFNNAAKGAGNFQKAIRGVGTALKAAGIGLALAALTAIVDIFRNSPAGAQTITRALETVNQAMLALWRNAGNFAGIMEAVFRGDFGLAAAQFRIAWEEISTEIGNAVAIGKEYAEQQEELRKLRNDNLVLIAKEQQAIEEARATAEDTRNDLRVRLEAYAEIEAASLRLVGIRQREAQAEIDLINLRNDGTIESEQRIAELTTVMIEAETERTTILKDAINQRNSLIASEQEQAIVTYKKGMVTKFEVDNAVTENAEVHSESRVALNEAEGESAEAVFNATAQALTNLSVIAGKETAAGKALAIAASLINTYQGITKALAQGGFLGIAGAVAVGAAGFAAVKNILDTPVPNESGSGAGTTPPQIAAPSFNIVGASTTSALDQQLASNGVIPVSFEGEPVKSYVVSTEVTSAQNLDRQIASQASF